MSDASAANNARIAQFRKMAADDPDNELGHLSLGRELASAAEHAEAVESFRRTLEINPKLSKAYQLLGESLVALDRRDDAITVFQRGVQVATDRGDRLPRDAMADRLGELGAEVPDFKQARKIEVGEGQVLDSRTGEVGPRLRRPPFRNLLGRVVYENVSATSWQEWIGMGTKVINELRLPLSDPKAQEVYDQHLIDFLNLRDRYEEARAKEPADKA